MLKDQINYLRHLKRVADFKYGRMSLLIQFLGIGASGMVIDLITYATLLLMLPLTVARGLAIWAAMSWNFMLNRRVTFSYAQDQPVLRQYVLFCLSCLVGAIMNWMVSIGLTLSVDIFHEHKLLAAFCGIVAGTAFNFILSSQVVFKRAAKS